MVDMGVQTCLVSDLSIEASRREQQVVVTKIVEEDVVKSDKALVGFPWPAVKGTGPTAGCQRCLARRPSRRGEQREKEEREKRSAQREKMKKEEKERNDELCE